VPRGSWETGDATSLARDGLLVAGWLCSVTGLLLLWTVAAHGVLRATGGARHPVDRTCHAIGYAAGVAVVLLIPVVGPLVGVIWWALSAAIMLAVGQRVHPLRAALAVAALPVAVGFVVAGGALVVTLRSSAIMAASSGVYPSAAVRKAREVADVLDGYGWQRGPPVHAVELAIMGALRGFEHNYDGIWMGAGDPPGPFTAPGSRTRDADIPVGDTTLHKILAMKRSDQLGVLKSILESVPDGLIAHRVGDFVFTYHGAPVWDEEGIAGSQNLWTVIMIPDPGANGPPRPDTSVVIPHWNYGPHGALLISYSELAAELQIQNALRLELGLPPLPDPATMTHASPAVAPPTQRAPSAGGRAGESTGDGRGASAPTGPEAAGAGPGGADGSSGGTAGDGRGRDDGASSGGTGTTGGGREDRRAGQRGGGASGGRGARAEDATAPGTGGKG
jgi:uncharacterized membrane protein YgcG